MTSVITFENWISLTNDERAQVLKDIAVEQRPLSDITAIAPILRRSDLTYDYVYECQVAWLSRAEILDLGTLRVTLDNS